MRQFKIRASAAGRIMGEVNRPTQKQLDRLAELEAKQTRTAKQDEELTALQAKRAAKPELSKGAKTYCELWLKEQLYGRRQEMSNKYTEKGIACEPDGINLTAEAMQYGFISKHEGRESNEYFEGECDLLLSETVEDIKNSWSCFTFPLFATELPESDYFYQLQVYMKLYNRNKAAVNYVLINAPEEIIDREASFISRKAGFSEVDMELYDEVRSKMTYDELPVHLRFKRFEFDRDDNVIAQIEQQVVLCREYIGELMKNVK
jgi:hypothetical protein